MTLIVFGIGCGFGDDDDDDDDDDYYDGRRGSSQ